MEPTTELTSIEKPYRGFPPFADWPELTAEEIDLWDLYAGELDERRQAARTEDFERAVEVAVRAAAVDTAAIEGLYQVDRGFTMTVATQAAAWQQAFDQRGEEARRHFEAQLEAYESVIDAVTESRPITEMWVRQLHATLCEAQDSYRVLTSQGWQDQRLPKGAYKDRPNNPRRPDGTVHAYAPVDDVGGEMARLIGEIRSPAFDAAHPVSQASYVHYALVVIHPFADGNGRVARAVASVFYYRACSIPVLIYLDQRNAYLDVLESADRGDPRALVRFFFDRGLDTLALVKETLARASARPVEQVAAELKKLFFTPQGLSHDEMDAVALRLLGHIENEVRRRFESLGLPEEIVLRFPKGSGTLAFGPAAGYRFVDRKPAPFLSIQITSQPPATAKVGSWVRVLVALDSSNPFPLLVQRSGQHQLPSRLEDAYPELGESLKARLGAWVEQLLSELLTDLEKQAAESLKKSGSG